MFTQIGHETLRRAHEELERLVPLLPHPLSAAVASAEASLMRARIRLALYDPPAQADGVRVAATTQEGRG